MDLKCDICSKTFSRQSDLRRHQNSVHGTHSFSCDKCEKKFTRKDKFLEHHRKCTIICKYCDSNFEHQRDLNEHELLLHTDKKYMCNNCGKKYSNKRELKNHRDKCLQSVSISFFSVSQYIYHNRIIQKYTFQLPKPPDFTALIVDPNL